MTALSLGLEGASGAALPAWSEAVSLLDETGSLGTFLSRLGTDPYWKALLTAAVVQPLTDCFVGVQKFLQATSGQAGMAVASICETTSSLLLRRPHPSGRLSYACSTP
jgi:hypothetical protein